MIGFRPVDPWPWPKAVNDWSLRRVLARRRILAWSSAGAAVSPVRGAAWPPPGDPLALPRGYDVVIAVPFVIRQLRDGTLPELSDDAEQLLADIPFALPEERGDLSRRELSGEAERE